MRVRIDRDEWRWRRHRRKRPPIDTLANRVHLIVVNFGATRFRAPMSARRSGSRTSAPEASRPQWFCNPISQYNAQYCPPVSRTCATKVAPFFPSSGACDLSCARKREPSRLAAAARRHRRIRLIRASRRCQSSSGPGNGAQTWPPHFLSVRRSITSTNTALRRFGDDVARSPSASSRRESSQFGMCRSDIAGWAFSQCRAQDRARRPSTWRRGAQLPRPGQNKPKIKPGMADSCRFCEPRDEPRNLSFGEELFFIVLGSGNVHLYGIANCGRAGRRRGYGRGRSSAPAAIIIILRESLHVSDIDEDSGVEMGIG